jgi:enoyl-CoA hydratase
MTVRFETSGRVAVITIDRPEARNAVDADVARGIEEGIDRLEGDADLWVGVLTGAPPVFCSGADLKGIRAGAGRSMFTPRGGFAGITARDRVKPIIAAVDGSALAGGTEIVLSCDLVIASAQASFGLPEVRRSLAASAGGLFRLGRKIPANVAMECILTGDPLSASRAYEVGLVNVLCGNGEAADAAMGLASRVCANAPLAVWESRRVALEAAARTDDVGWRLSKDALRTLQGSRDYAEGLSAFVEKRAPRWVGG